MTCRHIEELLPSYIENGIAPEERAAVERHIASCPACRAALAELERLEQSLVALRRTVPSWRAAEARFRRRIGRDRCPAFVRALLAPPAVAGIVIAAAGVALLPRGHEIAGALEPFGAAAAAWSAALGNVFAGLVESLAGLHPVLLSSIYALAVIAVMLGNMRFVLGWGKR